MIWFAVVPLLLLAGVMMVLESRGFKTTLRLSFKGDIKRESAAVAQWGQSAVTPLAAWLVWCREPANWRLFLLVVLPVLATSIMVALMKRFCGRMRPERENAGRFTGFSWKRDNARESFPSSHSACAFALSIVLCQAWPPGMAVFITLAIITAVLRYLMDAHYPSDVLAGSAIGLLIGTYGLQLTQSLLGAVLRPG
jgi:membrane-associated phospholipid phosphatase